MRSYTADRKNHTVFHASWNTELIYRYEYPITRANIRDTCRRPIITCMMSFFLFPSFPFPHAIQNEENYILCRFIFQQTLQSVACRVVKFHQRQLCISYSTVTYCQRPGLARSKSHAVTPTYYILGHIIPICYTVFTF